VELAFHCRPDWTILCTWFRLLEVYVSIQLTHLVTSLVWDLILAVGSFPLFYFADNPACCFSAAEFSYSAKRSDLSRMCGHAAR
jgi:hypothetical protein